MKKNDILEIITQNDIDDMNAKIELINSQKDNIIVKVKKGNKIFYLKKENDKLFISNNATDFVRTYYTVIYYIDVGTEIEIL